jgi:hypothetical protein
MGNELPLFTWYILFETPLFESCYVLRFTVIAVRFITEKK